MTMGWEKTVNIKLDIVLPSTTTIFSPVSPIYTICFSRTDHPQAFKYMTLNPNINFNTYAFYLCGLKSCI